MVVIVCVLIGQSFLPVKNLISIAMSSATLASVVKRLTMNVIAILFLATPPMVLAVAPPLLLITGISALGPAVLSSVVLALRSEL